MEYNPIVIFVSLTLIFKSISCGKDKVIDYALVGKKELISNLNTENPWNVKLEIKDIIDTKPQRYAQAWSKSLAENFDESEEVIKTANGMSAIFSRVSQAKSEQEFKGQLAALASRINQVAVARNREGVVLIGVGVGYSHEVLSKNQKIHNFKKKFLKLLVHLVVVFTFTMKTPPAVALAITENMKNEPLMETVKLVHEDTRPQVHNLSATAEWWATIHANWHDEHKPNIASTAKNIWVESHFCLEENAYGIILKFVIKHYTNFHRERKLSFAWIQASRYEFDPSDIYALKIIPENSGKGILVITAYFPEDFTEEQQDCLVANLGLSFEKHCPLAAEIAKYAGDRKSLNRKPTTTPEMEYPPVGYTRIFDVFFSIGSPVTVQEINLADITNMISEIGKPIAGGAFRRILKRSVLNNDIQCLVFLVLIIEEEVLGHSLKDITLNPQIAANIGNIASNGSIPDNYKTPDFVRILEHVTVYEENEMTGYIPSRGFDLKLEELISNPGNPEIELKGSVGIAILPATKSSSYYEAREENVITYCIIYCKKGESAESKTAGLYYKPTITDEEIEHYYDENLPINPVDFMKYKVDELSDDAGFSKETRRARRRIVKLKKYQQKVADILSIKAEPKTEYMDLAESVLLRGANSILQSHLLPAAEKTPSKRIETATVKVERHPIEGQAENPFYVIFESGTYAKTISDVMKEIFETFKRNRVNIDSNMIKGMKILPTAKGNKKINFLNHVKISGYCIRSIPIVNPKNSENTHIKHKVLFVLAVEETK